MIKRYYFYENLSWVRITQNFTNKAPYAIIRKSTLSGSLLLDAELAFGFPYNNGGNGTEPGSYYWASPGGMGLGIVNINQTGTTNYYAENGYGLRRIGIQLNATQLNATTLPGNSIT
jgi:hypothetical protein